jgi:hypothetical protein
MKKSFLMLLLVPMMAMAQNVSNSGNQLAFSTRSNGLTVSDVSFEKENSKFVGHYKSELIKNLEIEVFIENGKLFAKVKGEPKRLEMSQVSPFKFETINHPVRIEFLEDGKGVAFMAVVDEEINWLVKSE